MSNTTRIPVVCDCCGEAGLATLLSHVQSLQIEIRARRHGVWHTLTLDMAALAQFDPEHYCIVAQQECDTPLPEGRGFLGNSSSHLCAQVSAQSLPSDLLGVL